MEIKFCENNYTHGIQVVINKIEEEFDNVTIEVESCLGYCGDCSVGPFALVDDELVQADTPEELFEEIKGYL